MYQTLRELRAPRRSARRRAARLSASTWKKNEPLRQLMRVRWNFWSAWKAARGHGLDRPATRCGNFRTVDDLDWLIHRQLYARQIARATARITRRSANTLGSPGFYRRIAAILFEHDIYFQSIARGLGRVLGVCESWTARFEYLRALRYASCAPCRAAIGCRSANARK